MLIALQRLVVSWRDGVHPGLSPLDAECVASLLDDRVEELRSQIKVS
jgi:hypothetical protein